MFLVARVLRATYRDRPITGCSQLLLTKKPVSYDYVAVDVSGFLGNALRLSKNVAAEPRRHREVGRHVVQSIQQILKKIHCRKSLLLVMDGAEGLGKADGLRSGTLTRKTESRLSRLPGTTLMQVVEDRVVRMMPERHLVPSEVVICGTRVAGCVEEKMTAWALDLACCPTFNGTTDSLCLIGGSELFLNAVALSPYYNVTCVVQSGNDMKQMQLGSLLEWLRIDHYAAAGESTLVARARTDMLFLLLTCQGCTTTDLAALNSTRAAQWLDGYHSVVLRSSFGAAATSVAGDVTAERTTRDDEEGADRKTTRSFLFADSSNHTLELDLVAFRDFLQHLVPVKLGTVKSGGPSDAVGGPSKAVDKYLEHVLQSHALLCLGDNPDPFFVPQQGVSLGITPTMLLGHVQLLIEAGVSHRRARTVEGKDSTVVPSRNVFWSRTQPLTAAEYTLLCQSIPNNFESILQGYMGVQLKPEVGKRITSSPIADTHKMVQELLSYADPQHPHRCLCFAPSYCWLRSEPMNLWRMGYVDVGVEGRRQEIRRVRNAVSGMAMARCTTADGPLAYEGTEKGWQPVPFPSGGDADGIAVDTTVPLTLKVLSWNVMFDRYSGQPTPLGMPGIDWCSPQRYPVLAKLIDAEDADVVGMQEVEPAFLNFLMEQPWCQERYILSCSAASSALSPWGIMMLIHRRRLPVTALSYVNIPGWAGHVSLMPIATVQARGVPVQVAAIHLLAPFTKQNENARTGQDAVLRQRLTKGLSGDVIAMGDFNDWPTSEFVMPPDTKYVECWPLLHPGDPGKTMDETNTFCKLKIEEMFFGRSDKVFLRSSRLKPVEAHLVGTRSVNEENSNDEAPAYLFPSDHYGVSMTFEICKPPHQKAH